MTRQHASGSGRDGAPWRPVQYLGNKLRVLDRIGLAVRDLAEPGEAIWEPFAGSTVVAQSLAASGRRVIASDALAASAAMASALLGVGRPTGDHAMSSAVARVLALHDEISRTIIERGWADWVEAEDTAIASNDGPGLLALGDSFPQRWRDADSAGGLSTAFGDVDIAARERIQHAGSCTSTYAGTYFGLRQAMSLDALRSAVEAATPAGDPESQWIRSALLTALCSAASSAAFTPGKHFAQPHRIREGKDLAFHARRALSDRSVDVVGEFTSAAARVQQVGRQGSEGHAARHQRVEEVDAEDLRRWGVKIAYADPPYTAQQYSRFYHLLDVLVSGVPAELQRVRGDVTRGLYPTDRYLSPFCSRVLAPEAAAQLALTVAKADASLVLSYSESQPGSVGNARSISLNALVGVVEDAYGPSNVTVNRVPVRYRQFNQGSAEVAERDDPEFLIVGHRYAR